MTMTDKTKQ